MKLLSINLARTIWNFYIKDLNPRGQSLAVPVFKALASKYRFMKFPQALEEMDEKKGIQFQGGEFVPDSGKALAVSLSIFDWGLVADTRSSTDHSEMFLKEAIRICLEPYQLPPYESMIKSKSYVSEMYVSTERSLNSLNPKLEPFIKQLTSLVKGHDAVDYHTAGLAFWNNPSLNHAFPFRFERQEGTGFKENRYYSIAPLETDAHIHMLNELENILD